MDFITNNQTNPSNKPMLEINLPYRIYTPVSPPSTPPSTPITGKTTPAPSTPIPLSKKIPISPISVPQSRKNPAPDLHLESDSDSNSDSDSESESEEEMPYEIRWGDELARRRRRAIVAQSSTA